MLLDVLDESLLHSVREALQEDIGTGDITAALLPPDSRASASVICREPAVLCGMAKFLFAFDLVEKEDSCPFLPAAGGSGAG